MRFTGANNFIGMRAVSCVSTLLLLAVVAFWLRKLTEKLPSQAMPWPILAPAIFLAAYRFTGAWYDIERLDLLFMFLSVLGGYLLTLALCADQNSQPARGLLSYSATVASAVAFSIAFIAKQQAILFAAGALGALIFSARWKHLVLFLVVTVGVDLMVVSVLNRSTSGWFSYYCFHVPLANGIRKELALQFLCLDLPLLAPMIGGALFILLRSIRSAAKLHDSAPIALFISQTVMALAGSFLSRAHWGGAENVLMAGYLFLIMSFCLLAAKAEFGGGLRGRSMYVLALVQMAVLLYRPDLQLPHPQNYQAGQQYTQVVNDLNREGEILCVDHGGFSTVPHFHLMALTDVYGSEKGTPEDIQQALLDHKYAAIVTDALPDAHSPLAVALDTYPLIQKLSFTGSWIITGFPTPSPQRTVYILRPRKMVR